MTRKFPLSVVPPLAAIGAVPTQAVRAARRPRQASRAGAIALQTRQDRAPLAVFANGGGLSLSPMDTLRAVLAARRTSQAALHDAGGTMLPSNSQRLLLAGLLLQDPAAGKRHLASLLQSGHIEPSAHAQVLAALARVGGTAPGNARLLAQTLSPRLTLFVLQQRLVVLQQVNKILRDWSQALIAWAKRDRKASEKAHAASVQLSRQHVNELQKALRAADNRLVALQLLAPSKEIDVVTASASVTGVAQEQRMVASRGMLAHNFNASLLSACEMPQEMGVWVGQSQRSAFWQEQRAG